MLAPRSVSLLLGLLLLQAATAHAERPGTAATATAHALDELANCFAQASGMPDLDAVAVADPDAGADRDCDAQPRADRFADSNPDASALLAHRPGPGRP